MRTFRTVLASLAVVAAATMTGAEGQAAPPASPAAPAPLWAAAPDGFLYAWEHAHAGGFHCRWDKENANWAGCRNRVSDVWNNGFPGRLEDVRLFYGLAMTGSWVCLQRGESIPDLNAAGTVFTAPGRGRGERVNDNVSSHDWVDAC
ncbi:peptidase inhibitor family I36 protein [Streptomyces sp. MUM 178J]|uniref:peptidase inhibitor family I36 protein n=1 Tax=Streptomyces sp. MUM 178J TaxID=2791991 RepID=UPI001F0422A8|nr:peptidase inhibitor family I36 protein [Streptomyces sp. MUM 178J]WRQ80876.1 peptidase inhibitor family I36 protein [Streptomyces sp. MUM 178J]